MAEKDDRLYAIAYRLFAPRGYSVDCTYISTKEFRFKWRVGKNKVILEISDYIDEAPDIVIEQFLRGAMTFIFGGKHVFGKEYMDYIRSDEFILLKRPIYFRRSRRLTRTDIGQHRNLFDSVQRLMDRGLLMVSDIDNSQFSWTSGNNRTRLGYCSSMFRIVAISSIFDNPEIDEELLDFVVYHECMHLRQGYRPFDRNPHDAEFHRCMKLYPGAAEMEKRLRSELKANIFD